MFKLAINSARGPGVSTRWAALICAIPALLILPMLATAAFPQATADAVQASVASPGAMAGAHAVIVPGVGHFGATRALRVACARDSRLAQMLPSTKGLL